MTNLAAVCRRLFPSRAPILKGWQHIGNSGAAEPWDAIAAYREFVGMNPAFAGAEVEYRTEFLPAAGRDEAMWAIYCRRKG